MINIPGNRPVRPPTENNRVMQKNKITESKEANGAKPAKAPVTVERRRMPDRRQRQIPTTLDLRAKRDRRRSRRIDIDI